MTALCRGSANSAMGQVGSTMGRGQHWPGPGRASRAGWHCGILSPPAAGRLTAAPWPRKVWGGLALTGGFSSDPANPTPAGARCLPQGSAWPRRPRPIVFRAAAAAAILKLFSGLSEEGGAPAGDLGVTADEHALQPIRGGRASHPRGGGKHAGDAEGLPSRV